MRDELKLVVQQMSDMVLESASDLKSNRFKLDHQIIQLNIQIVELDNKNPKFIEHILIKDKFIGLRNKLEQIRDSFCKKEIEMKKSIPLKFRIRYIFRNFSANFRKK